MIAHEPERALWVCVTCRGRKKGCDKRLPKCGYCARRGLACVYHDAPPSHEHEYPEPRTSSTVRSDSQSRGSSGWTARRSSNSPASSAPEQQPGSLYEFLGSVSNGGGAAAGGGASGGLDDLLNREVTGMFQDRKLALAELAERYFRGFHKWLPIVSPTRFREAAAQAGNKTPPADFSLLVMAMFLVSVPQSFQGGSADQPSAPMSAYLTIKMLFAQTQAVICASTALVQAGLMIAAYEYACQKLNPAYISIGTCVRIAHALSLDKTSLALVDGGLQLEPEQKLRMLEDWNVWWAVVVLERIIMVELSQIRSQPAAELPAQGSILPTDLKPGRDFNSITPIDTDLLQRAPEAPFDSTQVQSFGRQAQAVYLLDQVIRISNLESGSPSRQMELQRLDREIQTFLGMVLDECERLQEFRCSVVATAVRALFILHEKALSQEISVSGENAPSQQRLLSEAVLDTVTNIVISTGMYMTMETKTTINIARGGKMGTDKCTTTAIPINMANKYITATNRLMTVSKLYRFAASTA
ncbi:hypothetical protein V2A60_007441 [Cordyceps javanica]|uniref:Fungal specific transcription factordomain-containing protein n=1 Tax=Cordyceps javanica TaxID=43265 RepID=A0A545VAV2_9HYPO|nr:fungal specific transcription factordomain-containing protein [Cordyceps javanica]TQW10069.1 fungal specific transcription factor domain-containing protein [Cordyceps javanica]